MYIAQARQINYVQFRCAVSSIIMCQYHVTYNHYTVTHYNTNTVQWA